MPLGGLATAGLIAGAASGVGQTVLGAVQQSKANKTLKKAQSFYEKNKYQIPESAKAALGVSQRQASGLALPGEDIARARLGASTAQGLGAAKEAATSSSDVLSVLSSLYGGQMQGEQNLAMQGAQRYDRNQAQLQNALNTMANLENQKWQYNVLYPYQQMLGQAEAYGNKAAAEISGGLGMIGQTAGAEAQLGGAQQDLQSYKDMLGIGRFGQINGGNPYQPLQPIQPQIPNNLNTTTLAGGY
jgi:hypothetical protein